MTAILGTKEFLLSLSTSRPTMTAKEGRGWVNSHHTPIICWGERGSRWTHNRLGLGSHLPVDHSCNKQGLQNADKFNITICDWGRRINPSFYFHGDTLANALYSLYSKFPVLATAQASKLPVLTSDLFSMLLNLSSALS